MSKKWILATLVILGIGCFWLSKNTWVTQKSIPENQYKGFLKDSVWKDESKTIWSFKEGNDLNLIKEYDFSNGKKRIEQEVSWDISDNSLMLKFKTDYVSRPRKINNLTTDFMQISNSGKTYKLFRE